MKENKKRDQLIQDLMAAIQRDPLIQTLANESSSRAFAMDRVLEVLEESLGKNRENYIEELESRIDLASEKIEQLEQEKWQMEEWIDKEQEEHFQELQNLEAKYQKVLQRKAQEAQKTDARDSHQAKNHEKLSRHSLDQEQSLLARREHPGTQSEEDLGQIRQESNQTLRVLSLESALRETKSERDQLVGDLTSLSQKLKEMEEALNAQEEAILRQKSMNNELSVQNKRLSEEFLEEKQTSRRFEVELSEWKRKVTENNISLNDMANQLSIRTQETKQLKRDLDRASEDLKRETKKVKQLEREMEDLVHASDLSQNSLKENSKSLKATIQTLREENDELNEKIFEVMRSESEKLDKVAREHYETCSALKKLESQYENTTIELESHKAINKKQKEKITELESGVNAAKQRLESAMSECRRLANENENLANERNRAKIVSQVRPISEFLLQQIDELKTDQVSLEKELNQDIGILKRGFALMGMAFAKRNEKIDQEIGEIQEETKQIMQNGFKKELDNEVKKLKSKEKQLNDEIRSILLQKDSQIAQLQKSLNETKKDEMTLGEWKLEMAQIREELRREKEEKLETQKKMKEMKEQLCEEMRDMEGEIERLAQRNRELERNDKTKELQAKTEELEKRIERIKREENLSSKFTKGGNAETFKRENQKENEVDLELKRAETASRFGEKYERGNERQRRNQEFLNGDVDSQINYEKTRENPLRNLEEKQRRRKGSGFEKRSEISEKEKRTRKDLDGFLEERKGLNEYSNEQKNQKLNERNRKRTSQAPFERMAYENAKLEKENIQSQKSSRFFDYVAPEHSKKALNIF